MRRLRAWGAMLALLAAAELLPARAAEPAPKGGENSAPWYRRIFGGSDKPKSPEKEEARPTPKDVAGKTLQEETAIYLQRLAVCDKLREIAVQTNNDELNARASELEKQATEIFQKRSAHLPGKALTNLGAEAALDRRIGTNEAPRPLRSAIKDAKGASASREQREVNP